MATILANKIFNDLSKIEETYVQNTKRWETVANMVKLTPMALEKQPEILDAKTARKQTTFFETSI